MARALIPPRARVLGRLTDIPDGGARGFGPASGSYTGLLAVRRGATVFVYVNACPHVGTPLDWEPDRFLTADGARLLCATHGAQFRIEDGLCVFGPCLGDRLESVPARVEEGMIVVGED